MAKFPLIGPSYTSQSVNADCQSTINLYPEVIESGAGNSQIVLYPAPGTKQFVEIVASFLEGLSGTASTTTGPCSPAEIDWTNPANILAHTPGTYASVELNAGVSTPPFRNVSQTLGLDSSAGSAFVWHITSGGGVTGPMVCVYPSCCNAVSPLAGDAAHILSIVDDVQGAWTKHGAVISWSSSHGSPDPAELNTFEYWTQVFPTGVPASWHVTITYNVTVATQISSLVTLNNSGTFWQFCNGVDQYNSVGPLAPAGTSYNGASITTTSPDLVVTTSNVIGDGSVGFGIPVGTGGYQNSGFSAGTHQASYSGSSGVSPIGTYNPAWTYGSPPGQDTVISTIGLTLGSSGEPCSKSLKASNFGLAIPSTVSVLGVTVEIGGHQNVSNPDVVLNVRLQLPDLTLSPVTHNVQLPDSDAVVTVGSGTDKWGFPTLTPAQVNDPAFTVLVTAEAHGGEDSTFDIYSVAAKVAFI